MPVKPGTIPIIGLPPGMSIPALPRQRLAFTPRGRASPTPQPLVHDEQLMYLNQNTQPPPQPPPQLTQALQQPTLITVPKVLQTCPAPQHPHLLQPDGFYDPDLMPLMPTTCFQLIPPTPQAQQQNIERHVPAPSPRASRLGSPVSQSLTQRLPLNYEPAQPESSRSADFTAALSLLRTNDILSHHEVL